MPRLSRSGPHRSDGAFTAEEVVDALYRGLLDRPVEASGLEYHLDMLERGAGLDSVVYGIGHSREYFETWVRAGDLPAFLANAWHSRAERRDEPPIFLLHIMKTGGTSLAHSLRLLAENRFCLTQVFLDHIVAIPPAVIQLSSLVEGHLGVEVLDMMPKDTMTATVIRDPVTRVLSHYAHVLVDPALGSEADGLTLEEFVHAPRWRPYCENFQARTLVHRVGLESMWRDRSPQDLLAALPAEVRPADPRLPLQNVFELGPLSITGSELRREALARLDSIDVVGVTEDLDTVLSELAKVWAVPPPSAVPWMNVSRARPLETEVPPSVRMAIIQANDVDLDVYEQARARAAAAARRLTAATSTTATIGREALPGEGEVVADPVRSGVTPLPDLPPVPVPLRSRVSARILSAAGRSHPARWPVVLALAATAVVAVVDNFFAERVVLIGLLVLGPCCALLGGRWRPTAWVGALSVALAAVSGLNDGIWATATYSLFLATVAIVALAVTVAAAVIEQGARAALARPVSTPWTTSATIDAGTAAGR